MTEENTSQLFRLKNIDETRKSFIEELNQNWLMSKKPISVCAIFSQIEHFLVLASVVTGYISVSDFASLVRFPKDCSNIENLCNNCGI